MGRLNGPPGETASTSLLADSSHSTSAIASWIISLLALSLAMGCARPYRYEGNNDVLTARLTHKVEASLELNLSRDQLLDSLLVQVFDFEEACPSGTLGVFNPGYRGDVVHEVGRPNPTIVIPTNSFVFFRHFMVLYDLKNAASCALTVGFIPGAQAEYTLHLRLVPEECQIVLYDQDKNVLPLIEVDSCQALEDHVRESAI